MAFIHFSVGSRSKLLDKAPASVHCAYLLREEYGPASAHVHYLLRQSEKTQTRDDLVYSSIHNVPAFAEGSPSAFFAAGETYGRSNANLAQTRTISLPRELTRAEHIDLCHDYLASQFGTRHPYMFAIHAAKASDGLQNDHVHVIYSTKTLDGIERDAEHFWKRYDPAHPEKKGARVERWFSEPHAVYAQRQAFADCCNVALERTGQHARVSAQSFAERGIASEMDRHHLPAWHPTQSKYGRGVSNKWQERLDGAARREEAREQEHALAAAEWEKRKAELGITQEITREEFLARVHDTTRTYRPAPRLPVQDIVQEEALLEQHEQVASRLQAEVIRHRHYAVTARHAPDAMRANAERLIAESEALEEDPWKRLERPLIGNRQSLIYHAPGEPNYGDVRPQNQVHFWSHGEAQEAGYRQAQNQHYGAGSSTPMAERAEGQRPERARHHHHQTASAGRRNDILPQAEKLGAALDQEEAVWVGVHYAYGEDGHGF
jgi:hypothetical protein